MGAVGAGGGGRDAGGRGGRGGAGAEDFCGAGAEGIEVHVEVDAVGRLPPGAFVLY